MIMFMVYLFAQLKEVLRESVGEIITSCMAVALLLLADETQFSLSVILCRGPAAMHPAADDNGTSVPYWPVSCYRCAALSCRSPLGCSSCLRLHLTHLSPVSPR